MDGCCGYTVAVATVTLVRLQWLSLVDYHISSCAYWYNGCFLPAFPGHSSGFPTLKSAPSPLQVGNPAVQFPPPTFVRFHQFPGWLSQLHAKRYFSDTRFDIFDIVTQVRFQMSLFHWKKYIIFQWCSREWNIRDIQSLFKLLQIFSIYSV